jgi:hypothetical protein
MYAFNPANNTWTVSEVRRTAGGFTVGSFGYVGTGQASNGRQADVGADAGITRSAVANAPTALLSGTVFTIGASPGHRVHHHYHVERIGIHLRAQMRRLILETEGQQNSFWCRGLQYRQQGYLGTGGTNPNFVKSFSSMTRPLTRGPRWLI